MLIVDGHLDLAWNALYYGRDLTRPVEEVRAAEQGLPGKGRGGGTVTFPEMRRGGVGLCFATILARSTGNPVADLDYSDVEKAARSACRQLDYYVALERAGEARIVCDRAGLDRHLAEWEGSGPEAAPLGLVVAMEGADPIAEPEGLAAWHEAGLRLVGITHYGAGRYAGGTGSHLGLTGRGFALLREMERLRIPLDLTHCSDTAFWQAVERFAGPVFASHNNCRALVPHSRQFTDEQVRVIVERDGVIGVALDVWMLVDGFVRGTTTNAGIGLDRVADHIDHICRMAGNTRHAAIGSDLDGLFGREQSPHDLDTIADLGKLADLLAQRGYGPEDLAAVFHGNWLRFLRATLPAE